MNLSQKNITSFSIILCVRKGLKPPINCLKKTLSDLILNKLDFHRGN